MCMYHTSTRYRIPCNTVITEFKKEEGVALRTSTWWITTRGVLHWNNTEMRLGIKEPNHIKCRRRTEKIRTRWEDKGTTPTEILCDIYKFSTRK